MGGAFYRYENESTKYRKIKYMETEAPETGRGVSGYHGQKRGSDADG